MRQIPETLLVTTYADVPGVHLVGHDSGPLTHLCPASRDEHHHIRHYWAVYELQASDAPLINCRHCEDLQQRATRDGD